MDRVWLAAFPGILSSFLFLLLIFSPLPPPPHHPPFFKLGDERTLSAKRKTTTRSSTSPPTLLSRLQSYHDLTKGGNFFLKVTWQLRLRDDVGTGLYVDAKPTMANLWDPRVDFYKLIIYKRILIILRTPLFEKC